MPLRDPLATSPATMPPSSGRSGWGPWADDGFDAADGPGLLVSPMFWLGGAVSLAMWACVTLLALHWL